MTEPFDAAQDLADAAKTGARLRPKDAATLIVVRREGGEPRVLMGRRASGHVFMASKWVFPGGRVDRADFRAPAATELRPEVAGLVERGAPAGRARALALAAVRETFEETGLLLACAAPPRSAAGPWRAFLGRGALPDLGALDYVARAVTPPGRTRRYDARFFMANAVALLSTEPAPGCGELDEIAWFALDEAARLDLPAITRFVIGHVRARLSGEAPAPVFVRFVRGAHRVDPI
jgi:8-oxo-dGTP pyrophosphatase MutT (NUDIX family)